MGKITSIFKLRSILKKYKGLLVFDLLGVIFVSAVGIPIPYITGKIVDGVVTNNGKLKILLALCSMLLVLYLAKYLISIGTNYLTRKLNTVMGNELKFQLISKAIRLPMSYITEMGIGCLQGRLSESETITSMFSATIISTLLSSVTAVFSLTTMLAINLKLGIFVLVLIPVFFLITKASNKSLTEKTKEMMNANVVLNAEGFEILNGVEDIKILNGEKECLLKFKNCLQHFMQQTLKQNRLILIIGQNTLLASDLGGLLILFISCTLIISGEFTVGLYTAFTLYSGKIFVSANALSNLGPQLKHLCLSIDRTYEILDRSDDTDGRTIFINGDVKNIKLDNVSFRYDKKLQAVLKRISFEISCGEKVLIRGENGSGKSTLIKLLLGLYKTEEGEIQFNGTNVNTIDLESLRNHIGIVSQNIFLFKGTVLDNIRFGQCNVTKEEIEEFIEDLNLRNYINKLPKGLDTKLLQNSGISGGQSQVIAFIRALVSKKDVLILDEPISNVDCETRELILNILKDYNFGGIIIIVSHITEGIEFISKIINL